jgi:hypothetical protein
MFKYVRPAPGSNGPHLLYDGPNRIFAFDAAEGAKIKRALEGVDEEKPSTQRHDLDDLAPGVDEAESDNLSPQQLKFLCDRLSPEDFAAYIKLFAEGGPDAEDSDDYIKGVGHLANRVDKHGNLVSNDTQRLTPPSAAMDAAIKASNGFTSRYGNGVRAYPVSDGTTNCDLRVDDGFRFTRRGR